MHSELSYGLSIAPKLQRVGSIHFPGWDQPTPDRSFSLEGIRLIVRKYQPPWDSGIIQLQGRLPKKSFLFGQLCININIIWNKNIINIGPAITIYIFNIYITGTSLAPKRAGHMLAHALGWIQASQSWSDTPSAKIGSSAAKESNIREKRVVFVWFLL